MVCRSGSALESVAIMLAPETLLDAAIRVVTRDGFAAMTLDAVAKEAGVSKGGLTHHFATKDALITAMLDHFVQRLLRELDRVAADDPVVKGRRVRAMMDVAFPELRRDVTAGAAKSKRATSRASATGTRSRAGSKASPIAAPASEVRQLLMAAIAASVVNPGLLEPLRQHAGEMRTRMIEQSADGLWQVVTWMALDGLLLWQMLGLLSQGDPLEDSVLRLLYKLSSKPPAAALEREVDHGPA